MKLFENAEPGESVQVDVKFVKIAGRWAFQYTALDDCTRFRVLRLYRRLHQSSSLAFLGELCRAFPFRIRKLQCDNGQEFPCAVALAVEALGSGTATSSPGARNRTARGSAVTGLTTRSSGAGSASTISPQLLSASGPGRPATTTSASPLRCRDGRLPKNSRVCCPLRRHNAMAVLVAAHRRPGVNLDETQHSRASLWTRAPFW
jgi:Integrase core domain